MDLQCLQNKINPVSAGQDFIIREKNSNLSEYDQEIPQSQTADKPMALRGRATNQILPA